MLDDNRAWELKEDTRNKSSGIRATSSVSERGIETQNQMEGNGRDKLPRRGSQVAKRAPE